jgi:hypothetical protein
MHLRFCSCRACKRGRSSSFSQAVIKRARRRGRRMTREMLKQGKWEDLPERISVPYTD